MNFQVSFHLLFYQTVSIPCSASALVWISSVALFFTCLLFCNLYSALIQFDIWLTRKNIYGVFLFGIDPMLFPFFFQRWEHCSWVTEAHGGISAKLKHLHSICSLALSWLVLFILKKQLNCNHFDYFVTLSCMHL
ncbi:Os06g0236266 [Oryza sativa Japonica Group]|jgi:hypothetical protein|uniref:Uncharacterized protein n=3 Tax=Oryza sativa TaxID=4530 RepID=A0A8J8XI44_ORYSJ|nr:hypothetical protein OsI_22306 [Oryza sativa Indica Group]EEE65403.1 hypothetical protein OsJ_20736 [Oryza sativa Japonica Group]KAB8101890.1 hypothetical protein EE612_032956 [Oryza sativa]BAS96957.1 Os06g0236266 [Oryza sativa Japonica Group]